MDEASTRPRRVAELRVHGVSGTPPETMLDDPSPRWVAGDTMGRIYRKRETIPVAGFEARVVEGYHWGRYTAGSASRALWLLLLPFALLNLAHFALLSSPDSRVGQLAERLLRLLGLVLTLALVVTTCYVSWEIVARQCDQAGCSQAPSWVQGFKDLDLSLRILITALAPAAVISLLWVFGRRPPEFAPPGGAPGPLPPEADHLDRARARGEGPGPNRKDRDRLGNSAFWLGAQTAPMQRAAHVTAACAVSGVLALATVGSWHTWAPQLPGYVGALYVGLLIAAAATGLAALGVVIVDRQPKADAAPGSRWLPRRVSAWLRAGHHGELKPDRYQRDSIKLPPWQTVLRWAATGTAVACLTFAVVVAHLAEPGPGAGSATFETAVAAIGLLAGVLLPLLLAVSGWLAWSHEGTQVRRGGTGPGQSAVPAAFQPYYLGLGSVVLTSMAITVAFGFSTAVVWWTASLLGTPDHPGGNVANGVELATGYWTSAVVWGGITAALMVTAVPLAAWMLQRIKPWLFAVDVVVILVATAGAVTIDSDLGLICLIVLVIGLLISVAGLLLVGRGDYEAQAGADYAGLPKGDFEGRARVARSWRIAMIRHRYHHALGAVAIVGGLASLIWAGLCLQAWWAGRGSPQGQVTGLGQASFWEKLNLDVNTDRLIGTLTSLGVTSATVTAAGLAWLGISTWRKPKIRTMTGITWDMLSFWPRVAHPLCPVPYGGRAVRAVAKRASELVDENLGLDVDGTDLRANAEAQDFDAVVLSGHSQGSVITLAAAAVIRRCRTEDGLLPATAAERVWPRLKMVTYGSQLQFIYARMFPSYLGFHVQRDLYQDLGGRWRNLYRWTDPLGGPVLSWPTADARRGQRFGPSVEHWTTAGCPPGQVCEPQPQQTDTRPPYRRWGYGPDIRLRDPGLIKESAYAPRVSALGHSGYLNDPGFDQVVAQLGADQAPDGRCGGVHDWPKDEPDSAPEPEPDLDPELEPELEPERNQSGTSGSHR